MCTYSKLRSLFADIEPKYWQAPNMEYVNVLSTDDWFPVVYK